MNDEEEYCDACASGGDVSTCRKDVCKTVMDGCDRPLTYCSKYKEQENKEQ
jgi:hypothetical protein